MHAYSFICGVVEDNEIYVNHGYQCFEVNMKRISEWGKFISKPGLK